MRAVVQRVAWAQVEVDGQTVARIEKGLLILLGIARDDSPDIVRQAVDKLLHLRIFANETGRFDHSVLEVGGSLLVVSQFTLLGDCRKGRRPNFLEAASPDFARAIYQDFLDELRKSGINVQNGIFQASMAVSSLNDGPVTLILDFPTPAPGDSCKAP